MLYFRACRAYPPRSPRAPAPVPARPPCARGHEGIAARPDDDPRWLPVPPRCPRLASLAGGDPRADLCRGTPVPVLPPAEAGGGASLVACHLAAIDREAHAGEVQHADHAGRTRA